MVSLREKYRFAIEFYLFQRKWKISEKNPKGEENCLTTEFRFESRLCGGKVLTLITSFVLDGNHLGCLRLNRCRYLNVYGVEMIVLLVCSPRFRTLMPTYPHSCNKKVRAL